MSSRTIERVTPGVILAFAFLLRMWDLGRNGLWYDEILQAQAVTGTLADLVSQLVVHAAMPLDYVLERGVLVLGSNELLLRFASAAFSTLAVGVIYQLGRAMFDRTTGLVAAGFLAVSSFAVLYAHEARPYSLYLLLTLTAFYWLYRALQTNRLSHWLYFGICLAGAVLSHLFALFVVLALGLFILFGLLVRVLAPRYATLFARITRRAVIGGVVVSALFLAALWLTPNAQFVWGSSLRFFSFLLSPQFLPPDQWYGLAPGETPPLLNANFLYERVLENFSGGGVIATGAFVGFGLVGILQGLRKPWEIFLLTLWAILPTAFIILFLGSRGTLFAARYLIASLPPWVVLCAVGTVTVGAWASRLTRNTPRLPQLVTLGLALVFVVIALDRTQIAIAAPKEEWRTAGKILVANVQPNDAVITPGGTKVVHFYAAPVAPYRYPGETLGEIADAENHAARVWLVMNRYANDPGGQIQAWLDGRGAVGLRADDGITVYYWRSGADTPALLADAQKFTLPPVAIVYASLGEEFAAANDTPTASAYFAQAVTYSKTARETASIRQRWGDAARRSEQWDSAAEQYRAALAADENQITAWIELGRVYLEQNQLPAAHDALMRALALDQQSYPALYFLADYYTRSGQPALAETYTARAAAILPELPTPP